jgi:hypothetical protein
MRWSWSTRDAGDGFDRNVEGWHDTRAPGVLARSGFFVETDSGPSQPTGPSGHAITTGHTHTSGDPPPGAVRKLQCATQSACRCNHGIRSKKPTNTKGNASHGQRRPNNRASWTRRAHENPCRRRRPEPPRFCSSLSAVMTPDRSTCLSDWSRPATAGSRRSGRQTGSRCRPSLHAPVSTRRAYPKSPPAPSPRTRFDEIEGRRNATHSLHR